MPALYTEARCKLDYRMIDEPRSSGPTIGYLAETPIAETVVDRFGRHFLFAGVTPHKPNGRYDVEMLWPGEFVVSPGLIYRLGKIEKTPQSISPKGVPLSGRRALGARGGEIVETSRQQERIRHHFAILASCRRLVLLTASDVQHRIARQRNNVQLGKR